MAACPAVAESCRWIFLTAAAGSPKAGVTVAPSDPEPPPRKPVGGSRLELLPNPEDALEVSRSRNHPSLLPPPPFLSGHPPRYSMMSSGGHGLCRQ